MKAPSSLAGALAGMKAITAAIKELGAVAGTGKAPTPRTPARTGPDASLDEQLTKALNSGQLQKFTKAVRKPLGLPPS